MTTIQDVIGDYTPLSNNVVKKLNLIRGALACKVFYTSNLHDRVCRMGLRRISAELGIDLSTASRNMEWLVENGYIERVKEHFANSPAHYQCTQKFYNIASTVAESNGTVAESNKEEDIKEDKETIVIKPVANVVGAIAPPVIENIPNTPKKILMAEFQEATGLKMPHKKSDIGFWWSNIGEILSIKDGDVEAGKRLIRDAVEKLKKDRLTIGGPESIVKTCRALAAETNGNGRILKL